MAQKTVVVERARRDGVGTRFPSRGGEDGSRPAAFGDAGTAVSVSGGETPISGRLREGGGGPGADSASAARAGEGVGSGSSCSLDLLGDLEASFSAERMSTYVAAAEGDGEWAVELYAWNSMVSAAFYEDLQSLEVALRTALHRQLTRCYGEA